MRLKIVIVLAFTVRLLAALYGIRAAKDTFEKLPYPPCCSDSFEYLTLARNIRFNFIFSLDQFGPLSSSTFRPPLYPFILALLWWNGPPVKAVLLLQAVLGALTVVLTYKIAEETFNETVGLIAAGMLIVAPLTNLYVGMIATETFYTFFTVLGCYLWLRGNLVLAGISFGLSLLIRLTTMPFLILLPIVALIYKQRRLVLVSAVALLMCAPWTIRNHLVKREFIPIATGGTGINLLIGTVPVKFMADDHALLEIHRDPRNAQMFNLPPGTKMDGVDAIYRSRATQRIKDDPWGWLRVRAVQTSRLFFDRSQYLHFRAYTLPVYLQWVSVLVHLLVLCLTVVGMWLNRKQIKQLLPLYLFPIALVLGHSILWADSRYLLPALPMLLVFAASALKALAATSGVWVPTRGLRC